MYVCVHVCTRAGAYAHVCMHLRRPEVDVSCLLKSLFTLPLRTQELLTQLGWLLITPQGSVCLLSHPALVLTVAGRLLLGVLMLTQRAYH